MNEEHNIFDSEKYYAKENIENTPKEPSSKLKYAYVPVRKPYMYNLISKFNVYF